jgi:uncharacterized membrane protein YidH (DUF202 family)
VTASAGRPQPITGAAPERTLLAWVRTALAFAGCALLLGRLLQPRHPTAGLAAVLAGVALAAALIGRASEHYRAAAAEPPPAAPRTLGSRPVLLLAVTVAATALAGAGLLAVLLVG